MLLENNGIRLELNNAQDIAYYKSLGWKEVKPDTEEKRPAETKADKGKVKHDKGN
jgi:hypothetical protein